jgi:hypothetical protein
MVFNVNQKEYKKRELLTAPFMTFDDMYHTKIYRIKQGMELKEIEKLEDYLIAKNKSYAVFGITRNEIKKELLLSEEEAEKYLKRKFVFSIGDVLRILEKIEDGELKSFKKNKTK